ncbi:MAG TPA: Dabb family protein, partial [Pirellulales bacterium]
SLCLLAVSLVGWTWLAANAKADQGADKMLVHDVYFTLNDNSPEAREKLVAACEKYLTNHPGTVFFAAGTVADLDRSVNQRDWDVGLHVVFKDRKAHDDYQVAPRHKQFIEENHSNWKVVRVFDTDVRGSAGH